MENKYYTPEISEFFVGFEYEIFEDFDYYPEKTWHKFTCEYDNLNPEHMSYPFPIKSDRIRVKYLDKQDVEDVINEILPKSNYSNKHKGYFTVDAPASLGYWVQVVIDARWGWDDIIIRGKRGDEEEVLFRGKIKNKSELKKLLTQIL